MRREEVDRILDSIKGNKPTARASITSGRLAALCRRWLAVEDAPVGRLDIGRDDFDDADMVEIVMDPNHVSQLQYERVRIVPDDVGGAGK